MPSWRTARRPARQGTTQNYADAVFVGYTPQRTTAVWVGFPEAQIPMIPPTTDRKVYGGTYPAMIWKDVMEAAHFGLPVEELVTSDPTLSVASTPIHSDAHCSHHRGTRASGRRAHRRAHPHARITRPHPGQRPKLADRRLTTESGS